MIKQYEVTYFIKKGVPGGGERKHYLIVNAYGLKDAKENTRKYANSVYGAYAFRPTVKLIKDEVLLEQIKKGQRHSY